MIFFLYFHVCFLSISTFLFICRHFFVSYSLRLLIYSLSYFLRTLICFLSTRLYFVSVQLSFSICNHLSSLYSDIFYDYLIFLSYSRPFPPAVINQALEMRSDQSRVFKKEGGNYDPKTSSLLSPYPPFLYFYRLPPPIHLSISLFCFCSFQLLYCSFLINLFLSLYSS